MITTAQIPGGSIRFFTPEAGLFWRAESVLTKEADTIRWIDGFQTDEVLWDIGANIGVYSLYAALRNRISVLAFEPSAATYYVLTKNIQLNAVEGRVAAYCLAFSDKTQLGVLNIPSPSMGSALSQFGKLGEISRWSEKKSDSIVQSMLGLSIDEFASSFRPLFPNYLKLDVDGIEVSILEGARATLRDPRLKSLIVELELADTPEKQRALQLLDLAGFRLASRGETQRTQTAEGANHLFERIGSAR